MEGPGRIARALPHVALAARGAPNPEDTAPYDGATLRSRTEATRDDEAGVAWPAMSSTPKREPGPTRRLTLHPLDAHAAAVAFMAEIQRVSGTPAAERTAEEVDYLRRLRSLLERLTF